MAPPEALRRLVDAVVPRAVEYIDLNGVLEEIDVDRLLEHVDVDAALARIDVDAVLRHVDVNQLLDRVDVDALLARVDVEALMERVDISGIVRRAQVDAIVSATAGGLGNRLLDLIRRQLVGLDIILTRLVDRLLHRQVDEPVSEDGTFTGQLAGGATRLAAFLMDLTIEGLGFAAVVAVGSFLASLFVGHTVEADTGNGLWRILALVAVAALYQWLSLVVAGRTLGRALAGLRVTAPDGSPLGPVAATRRVLVYPFSFVLGLGLVGIVASRRHRALHDVAAPSVVRYDWGDRPAEMPAPITEFLQRQGVQVQTDGPVSRHRFRDGRASRHKLEPGPALPARSAGNGAADDRPVLGDDQIPGRQQTEPESQYGHHR